MDSNHRSQRQQIYSLPPLATREFSHIKLWWAKRTLAACIDGAGGRTRTPDLLITNQLLYQLSYTSMSHNANYINTPTRVCQYQNKKYVGQKPKKYGAGKSLPHNGNYFLPIFSPLSKTSIQSYKSCTELAATRALPLPLSVY